MKKLIERTLFKLGDIIDKQNIYKNLKKETKAPYTLEELKKSIPINKTSINYVVNLREKKIEDISDSLYDYLGYNRNHKPDFNWYYSLLTPDFQDRFNKINDSSFWFSARKFNLSNVYKYKCSFIFEYLLPNGQTKKFFSTSYSLETNKLGQLIRLQLIQTDISDIDFINDNFIGLISTDPKLPSFYTTSFWDDHKKFYKNTIKLKNTEIDILEYFRRGLNNKDISQKLGLTEETIKGYRKEMLRKTERATMHELLADYILEDNNNALPNLPY